MSWVERVTRAAVPIAPNSSKVIMRERLWGIRVIRAFNKEPHEQERLADATRVMAENIIRANVHMGAVAPLALFIFNAARKASSSCTRVLLPEPVPPITETFCPALMWMVTSLTAGSSASS